MKKILSILFALLMILTIGTVNVVAEKMTVTGDVTAASEDNHEFRIYCDESDEWLALLSEKGEIKFYKTFNYKAVSYLFSFEGDEGETIKKAQDYAYIEKENMNNIYEDSYWIVACVPGYEDVLINKVGHEDATYHPIEIKGKDRNSMPEDVTVVEKNNGCLEISSSNAEFIINLCELSIYTTSGDYYDRVNVYETQPESMDARYGQDTNYISIKLDNLGIVNGETYKICINSVGFYSNALDKYPITFAHQTTKVCPEFNYELKTNGDLIITSDDTDWINSLARNVDVNEIGGHYAIEGSNVDGTRNRYFGVINRTYYYENEAYEIIDIDKINDNTISLSAKAQVDGVYCGQIINGFEYDIVLCAEGYRKSAPFNITFTKARNSIPNDAAINLSGRSLVVTSNDTNFIKNINYIDIIGNGRSVDLDFDNWDRPIEGYADSYYAGTLVDDKTLLFEISDGCQIDGLVNGAKVCFDAPGYIYAVDDDNGKDDWIYLTVTPYNVTFSAGEGSGTKAPFTHGGSYKLPGLGEGQDEVNFTAPNGKEFLGWKVGNNSKIYFVNEKALIVADTTITAQWKAIPTPNKVTVSEITNTANTVKKQEVANNELSAKLNNSNCESLLTPAEKASGATVWMEAEPIENTSDSYKQLDRAIALESGGELLKCLEINLFKKVGDATNAVKISETPNGSKATITLDLTGNQDLIDKAVNGELYVYNIHNGRVSDLIRGNYNAVSHIFTFEASEFSAYGLVYVQNAGGGSSSSGSSNHYTVPNTRVVSQ